MYFRYLKNKDNIKLSLRNTFRGIMNKENKNNIWFIDTSKFPTWVVLPLVSGTAPCGLFLILREAFYFIRF
jgi:hypothetical protein